MKTLLLGGLILLPGDGMFAQSPSVTTEATSVLVQQAEELLKENRPAEVLPYLQEILVRMRDNTDEQAVQLRKFCMYQIGVCQMQMEQYPEAIKSFDAFIKEFPRDPQASAAMLLTADCYTTAKDWSGAEKYALTLSESRTLDPVLRPTVLQILAEALYNQEKWQDAVKPLRELLDLSKEERVRQNAAVMLMTSLAKIKDVDGFIQFLSRCDESVRQSPAVNAALIETGDQKRKENDWVNALILYQSVLMRDELVALYEKQIQEAKDFLARGYTVTVGGSRSAYEKVRTARQAEMDKKIKALEELRKSEGYDMDLALRIGQCYAGMKRYWPAWTLFRDMYKRFPDHELAEDAHSQAFAITLDMQRWADAAQEGSVYLERYPRGRFTDEVSLNLIQVFLQTGQIDQAQAAGLKALELSPQHRFMDQVKYLLGYISFQKMDYRDGLTLFTEVYEKWPDSHYHEASEYWIAMCRLFIGEFDRAITAFEKYLNNTAYPEKRFVEDASYRLGIALYGAGRYADAEKQFRSFIDAWPASELLSEAYSMMGDLRGAEGDLDVALGHYEKARTSASTIAQINYAVFQTAAIYELQKRYPDIISMMESYVTEYGEKGNYAGAGFWIGKAYKALGQDDKALETYIQTIVQFGNKPENDEVDLILRELIKEHRDDPGWAAASGVTKQLTAALHAAESRGQKTLILRIQTLFADLTEGATRERYISNVLSRENIDHAGALTLLLIASEALNRGDADLVHEAYRRCMASYGESEIVADVMNIELQMLFKEGRYNEVIELAENITNRFGYRPEIGQTRKLKADALRLTGRYDEAIKTYQEIFMVREWRGPLTPQSLYWIGQCLFEQGKTQEAFAFFQRVYVLYGSYTEWVAKAYEGSILCLEQLGRTEDVIRTCREMLSNEAVAATPEGQNARDRLARLVPEGDKG